MLSRTKPRGTRVSRRRQPAAAVPRVAASALSLPTLEGVPANFTVRPPNGESIEQAALALVDGDILQARHWKGDIRAAITDALHEVAIRNRPEPLATLRLLVMDDSVAANLEPERSVRNWNHSEYAQRRKLDEPAKIGALIVCYDEEPYHAVIGPQIQALEKYRPGLGQTVLYWLNAALDRSSRALTPASGIGWAQSNYWMGEGDETLRVEEELGDLEWNWEERQKALPKKERKPFNREAAIAEAGIFTLKEYNAAIPPWAGTKNRPVLSLPKLARLRVEPSVRKIILATIAAAEIVRRAPHIAKINDIGCFEMCRWEICPFLLRWNRDRSNQDPLAMLWDDFMNQEYQTGETNMEVNSVFAWHDAASLRGAVKRFALWCRILQAGETLLRTLKPRTV
ncbi:MAG: hypothetical protein ACTHKU_14930 [Verrucomicrobiota bacterium]